jgi:single-strand DNA-binding protein
MAIRTQQSLSGFIVTGPELTVTSTGEARFYAKVGQEHFQRNDDGTFTQLESTFHNLVQYRKAAERSYERFQKGDHFVAEGYVHEYDHDIDGHTQRREEFVAKKIGHDAARQNYTVNRRTPAAGPIDQNDNVQTSGITGQPPAAETAAPVSARATASARSAQRRDQLADNSPGGTRRNTPTRSTTLAL